MGRLGGAETGYGSDADVMFVYDARRRPRSRSPAGSPTTSPAGCARCSARRRRRDPPLAIDAGLRPEGRNGALVRSLASYERYYARWSSAWEAQALLRARPIAGDAELGRRFVEMIDPVRYPEGGVAPDDLIEIRRLKGRIDSERLPRGADPTTHTKLGRGGLADIEWTVQLLQLDHGHTVPGLRTTRTLDALRAAREVELLTAGQADVLATAWRLATRARNAMMLVRDKAGDQLPHDGHRAGGGRPGAGLPAGHRPRASWSTTTAGPRGGPARWSSRCSTGPDARRAAGAAAASGGRASRSRARRRGGERAVPRQQPLDQEAEADDGRAGDGVEDEVVGRAHDDRRACRQGRSGRGRAPTCGGRSMKIAMPHQSAHAMCRLGIAANWLECLAMCGSASEPHVWNFRTVSM